jgi:hypothetical protein
LAAPPHEGGVDLQRARFAVEQGRPVGVLPGPHRARLANAQAGPEHEVDQVRDI